MTTTTTRIYVARLVGLPAFDPHGDHVGKVADLVIANRSDGRPPRVLGMIVEMSSRRRIFLPMGRVTHLDASQIYTTGLLQITQFQQRANETLVIGQMLDRPVTITSTGAAGTVYDVAMERERNHDWVLTRVAIEEPSTGFRRRGQTHIAEWGDVVGLMAVHPEQGAARLVETLNEMLPADAASTLHELPSERRTAVVAALDDERLAELMEELSPEDQVDIMSTLEPERAADVLEEMSADDAADLIADLTPAMQAQLLDLMEPEEAEDVRRLMVYGEHTAGGMMTPEPVIMAPDATIAEALAKVRREELVTSLAVQVFVCRPPLATPTGKLLGIVHIQRLLREPPSDLVGGVLDRETPPLRPDASIQEVATHLAFYNLTAAAVVDDQGRLLGVVTVDDLLDHLLPGGWRDAKDGGWVT